MISEKQLVGPRIMKRHKFKIGIAICCLCGIGWLAFDSTRDHNRIYFEKESGVDLPRGLTNVVHTTEFEFAFSSHYTIPLDKVERFIMLNELHATPPPRWKPIFGREYLQSPWDEVPTVGKLFYATGNSNSSAWDLLFDQKSGDLWTSVYYADNSGDLPGRVSQ